MEDFLAGKTDVSPLTGRLLKKREADQLRSALTCDPKEAIGSFMVVPPNPKPKNRRRR